MVGHVSKLVKFQLVRLIHFVSVVDMHHICFELFNRKCLCCSSMEEKDSMSEKLEI